jgi:hypothetical protein
VFCFKALFLDSTIECALDLKYDTFFSESVFSSIVRRSPDAIASLTSRDCILRISECAFETVVGEWREEDNDLLGRRFRDVTDSFTARSKYFEYVPPDVCFLL